MRNPTHLPTHLRAATTHAWRLLSIALTLAVALTLIAGAHGPTAEAQTTPQPTDVVPGRYLVKLAQGADRSAAEAFAASAGLVVVDELEQIGWVVVQDPDDSPTLSVPELEARAGVAAGVVDVEPVHLYELDGDLQPVASNAANSALASDDPLRWFQWGHFYVNATDAWEIGRGAGVVVAVIDSGVDLAHEDLASQIVPGGWDFVDDDNDPTDTDGHGTHVAGTIAAARNNGVGGTGVAPEAGILPVRVCAALCAIDAIANGIVWAVDSGADVINLSLGSEAPAPAITDAVAYAISNDVVVVATAGNQGANAPRYPGALPGVIAVGALAPNGQKAWFSNTGEHVDIAAPGVSVASTVPGGYDYNLGTSMAAPHVAAAAAILRSSEPALSNTDVAARLMTFATDLGVPGPDTSYGAGALDVYRALTNGGSPSGDYFEIEIDHPTPGDLRVEILHLETSGQVLFIPSANTDDDITLRYAVPPTLLDAAPGTWVLAVSDRVAGSAGEITGFTVHSSGIVYSYAGPPFPIADNSEDFTFLGFPVPDTDLSALGLSEGTLTPAFDPGTASYTASVPNSASVIEVTAETSDATATLEIDGVLVESGEAHPIALSIGDNAIELVVSSSDEVYEKTYTVTVTRAEPGVSSDADLSALTLSEGALTPAFAPNTLAYTASVPNEVDSIDVTGTLSDESATLEIEGESAASGVAEPVALDVGDNVIELVVTAEDGTTQKTYTVTVNRAAPPASSDADLSALTLSDGALDPTFDPATLAYTASVATEVSSIDVTATTSDENATLTINGAPADSGVANSIALVWGDNLVNVVVTAEDATTQRTYSITVDRALPPPLSDPTLSSLAVAPGTLAPAFAPGVTAYSVSVGNGTASISINAVVNGTDATLTVDGQPAESGVATPVALDVGANPIDIVVTSGDDSATETYTVNVSRAAAPPPPSGGGGGGGGSTESVTVDLIVTNDDGGSATEADFTVFLDGTQIELDETVPAVVGLRQLTIEGPTSLYSTTFQGDCDTNGFFVLELGDSEECTIRLNDQPLAQVLSTPLPDAETLIEETLSVVADSIVLDGIPILEASSAETPPLLKVTLPLAAIPGAGSVTVSVVSGNADAAEFNPAPGTIFVAGMIYEITVLDASGQPITDFAAPIQLSFLIPDGATAADLVAYSFDPDSGEWVAETSTVVDGYLVVSTDHLTTFALFALEEGGGFVTALPAGGVALTLAEGGSFAQFQRALTASRVSAVFVTHQGRFVGYLPNAPAFVNQEFLTLFADGIPPGRAMIVAIGR